MLVNASTRSLHTQLNKLILVRLPLALPPHSTNSSKYVSGLLHVAPIYITFESLWQSILDSPCLPTDIKQALPVDDHGTDVQHTEPFHLPNVGQSRQDSAPKICSRTRSLLSYLRLPGLPRADRLRADLRILTGKSNQKIDEELKAISLNGKLAQFIAHTKQSVEKNPHVLVAYAWVLYMALFSGGRYLRAALKAAGGLGQGFWDREPSPVRPHIITRDVQALQDSEVELAKPTGVWSSRISGRGRAKSRSDSDIPKVTPGLLFFEFIGDDDGEDIKLEFKRRIKQAELLLTQGEKDDIIAEAQVIFSFMLELVGELDVLMETNEEDLEMSKLFRQSPNLMASRDSVFVTQERLSRKTSNAAEKKGITPRYGYLDAIFTGPVAKLFSLNESSSRVSFKQHEAKLKEVGYFDRMWIQCHMVLLPILATLALFLVWYVGA